MVNDDINIVAGARRPGPTETELDLEFVPNVRLDYTPEIIRSIVKYYHRFGFLPTPSSIKNDLDRLGTAAPRVPHSQIMEVFRKLIDHDLLTPPGPFSGRHHLTNPTGFDWMHSREVYALDLDYFTSFVHSL